MSGPSRRNKHDSGLDFYNCSSCEPGGRKGSKVKKNGYLPKRLLMKSEIERPRQFMFYMFVEREELRNVGIDVSSS